ncbi:MAG: chorismate-binding protein [Sediminibacterium sp.]
MQLWENEHFTFLPPNSPERQAYLAWGRKNAFSLNESNASEIAQLNAWLKGKTLPIFGYLSFEAKKLFEKNAYENCCSDGSELVYFFEPEHIWKEENGKWICLTEEQPNERSVIEDFLSTYKKIEPSDLDEKLVFEMLETKESYIEKIEQILGNIHRGNYYETNFCMPLQAKGLLNEVFAHFSKMNNATEAPHAVYFNGEHLQLLCTSPERFIQKKGNTIISQPIKGTIKRGANSSEDEENKNLLRASTKEQAENIMIVDLVRNDLSRLAEKASVQVTELCELHTFKTLHHLISTVEAQLPSNITFTEILAATFPMGSMTGAPKISAVQHMEKIELQDRGIYSGTFGVIEPNGNFDFNVIIRSAVYNKEKKQTTIKVGSAITHASNAESEYDECLLKAASTLSIFN